MVTLVQQPTGCNKEIHPAEPDRAAERAARLIAVRYQLAPHVAALIATLAGLGAAAR
jgi:hypothetical protein